MTNTWLDTETKAILAGEPPSKLAPPDTRGFSLVILSTPRASDWRLARALRRIAPTRKSQINGDLPHTYNRSMSHADAMLAQFELICCDTVSVFIADEVVANANESYLSNLYTMLLASQELSFVDAILHPPNARSVTWSMYCDQFLGNTKVDSLINLRIPYKKARIMKHWALQRGGRLELR